MIRRCDGTDQFLKDVDGSVGSCGREFDDVDHWTTCPHNRLPTEDEKRKFLMEILGIPLYPNPRGVIKITGV